MMVMRNSVRQFVAGGKDQMRTLNAATVSGSNDDTALFRSNLRHFHFREYLCPVASSSIQKGERSLSGVDGQIAITDESGGPGYSKVLAQALAIEKAARQPYCRTRLMLAQKIVRTQDIAG
jgi:hypothetical protein